MQKKLPELPKMHRAVCALLPCAFGAFNVFSVMPRHMSIRRTSHFIGFSLFHVSNICIESFTVVFNVMYIVTVVFRERVCESWIRTDISRAALERLLRSALESHSTVTTVRPVFDPDRHLFNLVHDFTTRSP